MVSNPSMARVATGSRPARRPKGRKVMKPSALSPTKAAANNPKVLKGTEEAQMKRAGLREVRVDQMRVR